MHEEKNQNEKTQTKVELEVIESGNKVANERDCKDNANGGKVLVTVTCDGAKLTKADAGLVGEITHEVWVTAKLTKADSGKLSEIDVNVHEKCGSKLTKADAGKA